MTSLAGFWGPQALYWSTSGTPVRNTSVTVLDAATMMPTILYTNESKLVAVLNPTKTDDRGNLSFYAVPGEYFLHWSGTTADVFVTVMVHPDDPAGSGGGVTDHGALTGLADDDHVQYLTAARGDARYYTQGQLDTALSGKASTVHTHTAVQITDFGTAVDAQVAGALAGKQPLDADLTTMAGLSPADGSVMARVAGVWGSRTPSQLKGDLSITKSDVGLANVDNTSDSSKPVSTATQTALDAKIDKTLVDAAGDLFVGTADNVTARLAVGTSGQIIVADSAQTAKIRWATRTTPSYDPDMDGLVAVAADPLVFRTQGALGTPGWAVRMLVLAGRAITGVVTAVHTAGTVGAGGVNGFAVADDSGVIVSSTVDDDALWATAGKRSKAFSSPIAAQSSDRYVFAEIRVNGYSAAPSFSFTDGSANSARLDGLMQSKRRSFVLSGSTWGNFDPTAASNSGGFMVFLALY